MPFSIVMPASRNIVTLLAFIYTFGLQAQTADLFIKNVPLADDTVQLWIYTKPGSDITYAHVHENETASLTAGLAMIEKYGGKLITLKHSRDSSVNRNVRFRDGDSIFEFDPNRIYSPDTNVVINSIAIIQGESNILSRKVKHAVKNLSEIIWDELKNASRIVALHNNKNQPGTLKPKWFFWSYLESESYSILSYIKKFDQSSASNQSCAEIYINPTLNNSEFFIVTQKQDFDILAARKYSVVLQNNTPVDDGSMSVYAFYMGKRYINAEAKMGRVDEQIYMLELLHSF